MIVVAFSGVSGSGKTSLIKHLAKKLSCPYLLFDDYADETTYPKDMKRWFEQGASLADIKTPRFIAQLDTYRKYDEHQIVLIEEPFGRCRESISSLIDYVVLLDMPMEVCLSRVIKRSIEQAKSDSLKSITNYLAMYDDHFRDIYIALTIEVRKSADFMVRDVNSVEEIAQQVKHWLSKQKSIAYEESKVSS